MDIAAWHRSDGSGKRSDAARNTPSAFVTGAVSGPFRHALTRE
jgi:hypothetical protein